MTLLLSLTYTNMLNYNGYSPGKKSTTKVSTSLKSLLGVASATKDKNCITKKDQH